MRRSDMKSKLGPDRRGVAAVEFALIAPPLIMLVFGAIQYGVYLGVAHSVQQLVNDAARVAIAGLDIRERKDLVDAHVKNRGDDYSFLVRGRIRANVTEESDAIVVRADYDASNLPIFALKGLLPLPSSTITQQSVVMLGGY